MKEITYSEMNGIMIPNLTNSNNQEYNIGKYGAMRKTFMEENKKAMLQMQMRNGTLPKYLHSVNQQAMQMLETLIAQMKVQEGITEEMKDQDNLAWTGAMNSIKARAEEIVISKIVCI